MNGDGGGNTAAEGTSVLPAPPPMSEGEEAEGCIIASGIMRISNEEDAAVPPPPPLLASPPNPFSCLSAARKPLPPKEEMRGGGGGVPDKAGRESTEWPRAIRPCCLRRDAWW